MIPFERRQRLITLLQAQPGLRVAEVAQRLDVSEGTVRNDLNALESEGMLERVRGGARVAEGSVVYSPAFAARLQARREAKQAIARRAAEGVQDGDSLLLDASSTVYALCPFLRQRRGLTIFTNGIETGRELAKDSANTVILLGGVLHTDGMSINVPLNEQMLADLHIKTAFVSCSGFSVEAGLTEVDLHEARFKRKMIMQASTVMALIDASKFGRVDLTAFAAAAQVACLFTDSALSPAWQERLQAANVHFILCP